MLFSLHPNGYAFGQNNEINVRMRRQIVSHRAFDHLLIIGFRDGFVVTAQRGILTFDRNDVMKVPFVRVIIGNRLRNRTVGVVDDQDLIGSPFFAIESA